MKTIAKAKLLIFITKTTILIVTTVGVKRGTNQVNSAFNLVNIQHVNMSSTKINMIFSMLKDFGFNITVSFAEIFQTAKVADYYSVLKRNLLYFANALITNQNEK